MAKMFYTLDEAAEKLGKTADEVQEMATSGQLQEFRADGKLMLKKDQVDLIAGGDEEDAADIGLADSAAGDIELAPADSAPGLDLPDDDGNDEISLADSAGLEPIGLAASGSNADFDLGEEPSLGDAPKNETGISIFDPDDTEEADPAAQTQVTDAPEFEGFGAGGSGTGFDAGASGSGLLDLTRESDDTSLGADLLDDVYAGGEDAGAETQADAFAGGDLFESPAAADTPAFNEPGAAPIAAAAAEPYDGAGSGLVGGLAIGMIATLAVTATVLILAQISNTNGMARGGLVEQIASQWMIVAGAAGGLILVAAILGWVLGRKS